MSIRVNTGQPAVSASGRPRPGMRFLYASGQLPLLSVCSALGSAVRQESNVESQSDWSFFGTKGAVYSEGMALIEKMLHVSYQNCPFDADTRLVENNRADRSLKP